MFRELWERANCDVDALLWDKVCDGKQHELMRYAAPRPQLTIRLAVRREAIRVDEVGTLNQATDALLLETLEHELAHAERPAVSLQEERLDEPLDGRD